MNTYNALAIKDLKKFVFGTSPNPVTTKSGLVIGGGMVYPELNFTLPPMDITVETWSEVERQYTQMINDAGHRAVALHSEGIVVEFELLPPMTHNPEWGARVTAILRKTLDKYAASDGLKGALRITPNDIREHERPPVMWHGHYWDNMVRSFELNAQAGADILSIESTGGKEIHDDAIMNADLPSVAFALGILGARDMERLWDMIVGVSNKYGVIPGGDTACGFGNTAMVLADKQFIPKVWAAVIRVMTAARTLVAHERGAIGPSKDCAYENPYIKAITGCPISMEGAEASVAHLSPIGNIPKAVCDLWSNESVQNLKLLGGMAPTVSMEQLTFSTRLMNVAISHGADSALTLRDWFSESDVKYDPQAYILRPDVVLKLASQIIEEPTAYGRVRRAALATLAELREAYDRNEFMLQGREVAWLDMLSDAADDLPETEAEIIEQQSKIADPKKVNLAEYGL
ncbi:MAG: methyltransferase MtaB domain-containing protein [Armatimonadota bacterium]